MKKLNENQMENLNGGVCIRQSDVQCGLLGLAYGFINPFLGAGVGLACSAFWDDVESSNPVIYGC